MNERKETYTREEVIELLKGLQIRAINCQGFIVGTLTKIFVVKSLLGDTIEKLGGQSVDVEWR